MSVSSVPDDRSVVNRQTLTRLDGHAPPRVLRAGALYRELDRLACAPPEIRPALWSHMVGLALEAADRCLALECCETGTPANQEVA